MHRQRGGDKTTNHENHDSKVRFPRGWGKRQVWGVRRRGESATTNPLCCRDCSGQVPQLLPRPGLHPPLRHQRPQLHAVRLNARWAHTGLPRNPTAPTAEKAGGRDEGTRRAGGTRRAVVNMPISNFQHSVYSLIPHDEPFN